MFASLSQYIGSVLDADRQALLLYADKCILFNIIKVFNLHRYQKNKEIDMVDFKPSQDENFNIDPYIGSIQQVLAMNKGESVICEFLIGASNLVSKSGILFAVADKYFVLYHPRNDTYTVCDIYSVKFVTFLNSGKSGSVS